MKQIEAPCPSLLGRVLGQFGVAISSHRPAVQHRAKTLEMTAVGKGLEAALIEGGRWETYLVVSQSFGFQLHCRACRARPHTFPGLDAWSRGEIYQPGDGVFS